MDSREQIAAISKPQLARLKDLGMGLKIGTVWGTRVLIQPIDPYTEIDRIKKEGLLVFTKLSEESNKPKPSTGVIVQLGEATIQDWTARLGPETEWPLREGYMVMFGKYAGAEFIIDQVEYRILDISEIMCTVMASNPEAYAPVTD